MTLTTEQLAKRKTGLGGSDVAALLGLSPYTSPFQLWAEKTGRTEPEDISDKFAVKRGNDMEALVCKWFCEETGLKAHRVNKTLTHPEHPYLLGHIDRRIVGVKEGLEAKTANWRMIGNFGTEGTDEVPPYYLTQCYVYMILTGWRVWHLAADLGGDFKIFRIEYDGELGNFIAKTAHEWWQRHVVEGVEVEPVLDSDLKIAFPTASAGVIKQASPEIRLLSQEVAELHRKGKDIEKTIGGLKAQIKASMGEADVLMSGDTKLATWKNQTRTDIDRKVLEATHPEIFAECKKTTAFRVFRPNLKL